MVEASLAALEIARKDPTARDRVAVLARHAAGMAAHRGGAFVQDFDQDAIEALIEEGLAAATDPRERAWLLVAYGALIQQNQLMAGADQQPMQPRLDAVNEASGIAARLDDPNLMTVVANTLSDLYIMQGERQHALAVLETSLPYIERIERAASRAQWFHSASLTMLWLTADPRRAESLATKAYEMGRGLSAHDQGHGTYGLMATSYWLGDWDRVEMLLEEHLQNPELGAGVRCIAVQSGPSLGALVVAHRGDSAHAIEVARHSLAWEERPGPVEGHLAEALVAAGAIEEGRTLANDVLDRAAKWRGREAARALVAAVVQERAWDELPALLSRVASVREADQLLDAMAVRAEGLAFAAAGDTARARDSLSRALALFQGFPMVFEAARTQEALASVSDQPERMRLLGEVISTYRALGAAPHLARAEALQGA
jgi:tetratricopeptide (TPR) repeat protein